RNTNTAARLVVRVVEKPDALSNMSMQKERLPFLTMSVSVTTRIAVAIIIHSKNISRIIVMYWHEIKVWVNNSALLYISLLRRVLFALLLHTYRHLLWIEACLTMKSTLCISIYVTCLERKKLCAYSSYIMLGHLQNGEVQQFFGR